MGSSVTARCKCGFEAVNLPVGGGLLTFETVCYFPVFCKGCYTLQVGNLLSEWAECPACHSDQIISYDDEELRRVEGHSAVVGWDVSELLGRALRLTDGEYFCPSCREFTLRFERGDVLWD